VYLWDWSLICLQDYDILVVGGGPAGATAAHFLGQNGLKVLLIDKSAFPRDKPCGGGISVRIVRRFPYLDDELKRIPVNWVGRVYLESPAGISLHYDSDRPLYLMIRRYDFDNLLYTLAGRSVDITQGLIRKLAQGPDGVAISTSDGREFHAKLVIGADGANSFVARASGLRRGNVRHEYAIDMMEETPYQKLDVADRKTMYVYYGIHGHYGYGWIFPKCNYINLGVGFKLDYYMDRLSGNHYDHHSWFVEQLQSQRVVTGSSDPGAFKAFPIPVAGPLPCTYVNRVLLCGDAGGFVNAFTAEGIYYAMVSGECAAKTALDAVMHKDFSSSRLQHYEELWKSEIGAELQKSVSIQRVLLSDTTRIDRIVKAAGRNKALAHLLTQYATGGISYPDFKRSLVLHAFPLYIWEKVKSLVS